MEYRALGLTGLTVSRLCFGTLTLGPLQNALPVPIGARILRSGLDRGINFMDTAQLYRTYPYIREALRGYTHEVHVASKSYAFTREDMEKAVNEALHETGLERISVFLLHETESEHTIRGHWPAFDYLIRAKEKGLVAAIGVSTHHVQGVTAAARIPEIDVISPLINRKGIGIADGTTEEMLAAISFARQMGKGIYAMKPLGGGHLSGDGRASLAWFDGVPVDSVAVGMKSEVEVEFNCRVFSGEPVPEELIRMLEQEPRKLHVESWCTGCGRCQERCGSGAITVRNGRAVVNPAQCVLCGYCGAACPEFAIKII